jgi:hypothetical protein
MSISRAVYIDAPGHYATRLVKGGPEVGCRVTHGPVIDPVTGETMDRGLRWHVEIDGKTEHYGPAPHARLLLGRPITRSEYEFLIADRAWAREHAPHQPEARPREAVNLRTVAAIRPPV